VPARVALLTGASAGIGEATARALAAGGGTGVRLVLVARRESRLRALAAELGGATVIAADLSDPESHGRIAEMVRREHGALDLLINNAGARWPGTFAATGWENVARHLSIDLEAPVRLTEALLPLLRETAAVRGEAERAPVSIVNVASTAARIGRPGAGGYSAAKFALAGWSDSLAAEEGAHGVHVGLVLPGFVQTEGFPAEELLARRRTRWIVARPELAAEAILQAAGWDGRRPRAEVYVPRPYAVMAALRVLAPALVRRAVATGAFSTTTRPRD
jgi:short-subunit dehydrogenase